MRILQQTVLRLNSYYLHILCTKVSTATGAVLGGEGQFLDFELVDLDVSSMQLFLIQIKFDPGFP